MIKCKEGKIKIRGTKEDVLAEITTLINALVVDKKFITTDEIKECVRLGTMKQDALQHELMDKLFSKILDALGEDEEDGE